MNSCDRNTHRDPGSRYFKFLLNSIRSFNEENVAATFEGVGGAPEQLKRFERHPRLFFSPSVDERNRKVITPGQAGPSISSLGQFAKLMLIVRIIISSRQPYVHDGSFSHSPGHLFPIIHGIHLCTSVIGLGRWAATVLISTHAWI